MKVYLTLPTRLVSSSVRYIAMAAVSSCIHPSTGLVAFPCGGQRPAAVPPPATLAVAPGDIVGVVVIPWRGAGAVGLDGGAPHAVAQTGRFAFAQVGAGRHVLETHALGFQARIDTVIVPANGGVALRIHPRQLAVCPLIITPSNQR